MTLEELLEKKEKQRCGEPEMPEKIPNEKAYAVLSEDPELSGTYDQKLALLGETLSAIDKCLAWGSFRGYAKRDLECLPVFAFPDSAVDSGVLSCGLIYESSADYQRFADITDTAEHKAFFAYEKSVYHTSSEKDRVVIFSDGKEAWQMIVKDGIINESGTAFEKNLLDDFFGAADALEKAFHSWLEKDVTGKAQDNNDYENAWYNPVDDMYKLLFESEAPDETDDDDDPYDDPYDFDDDEDEDEADDDYPERIRRFKSDLSGFLDDLIDQEESEDGESDEERLLKAIFGDNADIRETLKDAETGRRRHKTDR